MADRSETVNDDSFKNEKYQYVQQFCSETTLHGVRFLVDRKGLVRLLWFLSLGTAFVYCGIQIYWTFHEFSQRPFSTTVITRKPKELNFPAVTICNLNYISKKEYAKTTRARDPNRTEEQLQRDIQIIMNSMRKTGYQQNISRSKEEEATFKKLNASDAYNQPGYHLLNTLKNYSHQIEGMLSFDWIEPCMWRGVPCSAANFTPFVTFRVGQCFTFNSGDQGHERLKTFIPGPTNGLRLRLNVEEKDHVGDVTATMAGFKVSIQHQDEYPAVEEFGFALEPGTHTFAAIRAYEIKKLKHPFAANCSSPENHFSEAYNKNYSVNTCSLLCFLKHVARECGCQLLRDIIPAIEVCSLKKSFECAYPKIHERRPQSVRDCVRECPEPCSQTVYETKLSYARAGGKAFIKTINSPTLQNKTLDEKVEYIRNNMVSLDVFFEEIRYDIVEEKESISSTSLFGTVGGYLGLFLGMSLLTLLEFLDFLCLWISKVMFRGRQTTPVQNFRVSK